MHWVPKRESHEKTYQKGGIRWCVQFNYVDGLKFETTFAIPLEMLSAIQSAHDVIVRSRPYCSAPHSLFRAQSQTVINWSLLFLVYIKSLSVVE